MAPSSKKPSSPSKTKSSSSQIHLKRVKGENFYRDAKKVTRLKMLSGGKPIRDKDGKIVQAAAFQKGEDETKPGRVQPDRRWFGMLTVERGLAANRYIFLQETPESSHRQRWTTSGPDWRRKKTIHTLSFCGGISCLWPFSMMLPIPISGRCVYASFLHHF